MQPAFEALMTGASALSSIVMAFTAGAVRWHWGRGHARTRRAPSARSERIGPYVLQDKLGSGAMGEVYRARHSVSGREHALKLLARGDERQRRQFEREASVGEQLWHPNKVSVYDHGQTPDGTPYIVMELVDGVHLEALVERDGPLSPRRVLRIVREVAAALAEVHEHGFVHRDIKPSNILVYRGEDGEEHAKLLDFGLVKDVAEASPGVSVEHVVGTPLYISPEALTAPDTVDGRTDIYGLGAVAYYLLSGSPVFTGRSVVEVCAQHLLTAPAPLPGVSAGTVSPELGQLVLDCLAKDPATRPASARHLIRRASRCPEHSAAPLTQRSPQPSIGLAASV